MDFIQFLNSKKKQPEQSRVQHTKDTEITGIGVGTDTIQQSTPLNELNSYSVKTGDFVKIVFKENSPLNIYKGYIGEIRDYRKGQQFAMVMLEAIVSKQIIKFSIDHFIHLQF